MLNEEKIVNKQEQTAQLIHENKRISQCAGCSQPLGIVSTMLYEIDEKPYCSECYSIMIGNKAAERDR